MIEWIMKWQYVFVNFKQLETFEYTQIWTLQNPINLIDKTTREFVFCIELMPLIVGLGCAGFRVRFLHKW